MSATATKHAFSGDSLGRPIKVAATSTPGTLVHTVVSSSDASDFDEIWLWAFNSDTSARKLTIEFGGTASPDNTVELTIPAESGPALVIPGWILGPDMVVRAFCASANVVMVAGYVNRIVNT